MAWRSLSGVEAGAIDAGSRRRRAPESERRPAGRADRKPVATLVNDAGEFDGGPEALLLRIAKRGAVLA